MRKMRLKLAAFVTASAVLFAGCVGRESSNSSASYDSGMESAKAAEDYDISEEAVEAEYDVGTAGFADNESYAADDSAEPRTDDAEPAADEPGAVDENQQEANPDEKLVYTCDMRMQTLTYDETLANVRAAIAKVGGIIESESETNSGTNWYYDDYYKSSGEKTIHLTIRIPSKNYKGFLESLEGEGKILSKNSYVENITRRYHDTEAVIRNLEMQEERLQAMMEQARTIEDMITIETRLTEVQTQLDQNRTYLSAMDTDVAFSTVNLTIEEVVRYSTDPPKTTTFVDRLHNAFVGSWSNFLRFLEMVLFSIIYIAPLALTVLVIVLIVLGINKAWRKNHPKKPRPPKAPKAPKGPFGPMGPRGPVGPQGPGTAGPTGQAGTAGQAGPTGQAQQAQTQALAQPPQGQTPAQPSTQTQAPAKSSEKQDPKA